MKNIFLSAVLVLAAHLSFAQEKSEFKPSGKVWGLVFGDYYFKQHADSANRPGSQYSAIPVNTNAIDLRRIYLGYDYAISEKFSSEFLISHEGQTLSDGATRTVFVKAANVKWKNIFPRNDLVMGLQSTPTFALITDKIWAYRSIEKSLTDYRGVSKAVDGAVSLQGRLDSAGNYGYNLMVGNGSGIKMENDRFKKFYGDVYAKFMDKKIIVDLYSDYERVQLNPYHKSKMSMRFLAGYTTDKLTAGVEFYQQSLENLTIYTDTAAGKGDTTDASVFGASVFIRGAIIKDKLSFFVRADMYDPDSKFNKDYVYSPGYSAYNTEMFSVLGLDYTPVKNVHIMPNVWYNGYASRKKTAKGLEKADYDLVPRITIHYIFK